MQHFCRVSLIFPPWLYVPILRLKADIIDNIPRYGLFMGFDTETMRTKTEKVGNWKPDWETNVKELNERASLLKIPGATESLLKGSFHCLSSQLGGHIFKSKLVSVGTSCCEWWQGTVEFFSYHPTHNETVAKAVRFPHHADWLFLGTTCCYHTTETPLEGRNGDFEGIRWNSVIQFSAVWQVTLLHECARPDMQWHHTRSHIVFDNGEHTTPLR